MALVPELQDHGCSLRGNVICKYVKGEVVRCADCEYKKLTDNGRMHVAVDYYKAENVLDNYPLVDPEGEDCALCRRSVKNKATTKAYSKITNKKLDVRRDVVGSGGSINGGEIDIIAPACQSCMKNLKKMKLYHYGIIALAAIAVCAATVAINLSFPASSSVMSMFSFVVCVTLGVGLYIGSMHLLGKAMSNKTYLYVFDLPALRGFKQKGWYTRRGSNTLPTIYDKPPLVLIDPLRPEESIPQKQSHRRAREEKA